MMWRIPPSHSPDSVEKNCTTAQHRDFPVSGGREKIRLCRKIDFSGRKGREMRSFFVGRRRKRREDRWAGQ